MREELDSEFYSRQGYQADQEALGHTEQEEIEHLSKLHLTN